MNLAKKMNKTIILFIIVIQICKILIEYATIFIILLNCTREIYIAYDKMN